MLNFLRKLRRKDMNSKYLKYAVGEIVLVVIGILIALSINNWNERRKDELKAEGLSRELKIELQQIVDYCDQTIYGINKQIDFIDDILNIQKNGIDSIDFNPPYGLSVIFFMSSYSQFFDPPSDIYQTAINDGTFRLLTDEGLTRVLQEFHQSYRIRANELIKEEYALGREINDYLSKNYAQVFAQELVDAESQWSEETVKKFLLLIKDDGTLKYKLVERIATKQARLGFVLRFRNLIQEQIDKM